MPEFDVLVVGGLNSDFLVRGLSLPRPGETRQGDTFVMGPGGKGANQAVAVARLGGRVAMVGAVGHDDRGKELKERVRAEGVNVDFVREVDHVETGAALIHVDERAEKQILAVPGANAELSPRDVERACEKIGRTKVVLSQLEVPVGCVQQAFTWARASGIQTILDPAPPMRLSRELLSLVDVLKPNAAEAQALTGIRIDHRDAGRQAALKLIEQGARAVAVAAGESGNLLVWKDGEHWLPRINVRAVDATGAGDAFAGALAAFLARGRSLIEAATFANAAAAFKTTKIGAQAGLPRESDVRSLLHL